MFWGVMELFCILMVVKDLLKFSEWYTKKSEFYCL